MEQKDRDIQAQFGDRGIRWTKQRKTILDVLRGTTSHPTAEWVYKQVCQMLPKVSLGTVYRNLRILKDQGLIMELDYGRYFSRFDGNPRPHYHIVCVKCGKVEDLKVPVKGYLEEEVADVSGYDVIEHRLEFRGVCPECRPSNETSACSAEAP